MNKKVSTAFIIILVLCLAFSSFAYADEDGTLEKVYIAEAGGVKYESVQEALDASLGKEFSVKLLDASYEEVYVDALSTVSLDLNGKTVAGLSSQGTLSITDSGKGSVSEIVVSGGTFKLSGGTVSEIIITSGKSHVISAGQVEKLVISESDLEMTGGTVLSAAVNKNASLQLNGANAKIESAYINYGELILTNGTLAAEDEGKAAITNRSGSVTVYSGSITSQSGNAIINKGYGVMDINAVGNVVISGSCGIFNDEHACLSVEGSGNITISGTEAEAIRSESSEYLKISSGNISGYTYGISADTTTLAVSGGVISGGDAAVECYNSQLSVAGGTFDANQVNNSSTLLSSESDVYISSGEFNKGGKSTYSVYGDDKSQIIVSGGIFHKDIPSGMSGIIAISGGTFDADSEDATNREDAITACLDTDYELTKVQEKYTVSKKSDAGVARVISSDGAKKNYDDIYDAVAALQDNDTLTILEDLTELNRTLVIKTKSNIVINGKEIISSAPCAFKIDNEVKISDTQSTSVISGRENAITVNKILSIDGVDLSGPVGIVLNAGSEVSLYNTLKLSKIECENIGIEINGGTFNFYDGTISVSNPMSVGIKNTDGTLNIYSGKINSENDMGIGIGVYGKGTVAVDGGIISGKFNGISFDGSQCTINDGVIYGNGNGIELSGGDLTISGGSLCGDNYAVEVKSGNVNVSGGVIKASQETALKNSGSGEIKIDGGYIWGDKCAVSSSSGNISITSGIFKSSGAALYLTGGKGKIEEGIFSKTAFSETPAVILTSGDAELSITSGQFNNEAVSCYPVFATEESTISVSGGNFFGFLPDSSEVPELMPYAMDGNLIIEGGTYESLQLNAYRIYDYMDYSRFQVNDNESGLIVSEIQEVPENEENEYGKNEEPFADNHDSDGAFEVPEQEMYGPDNNNSSFDYHQYSSPYDEDSYHDDPHYDDQYHDEQYHDDSAYERPNSGFPEPQYGSDNPGQYEIPGPDFDDSEYSYSDTYVSYEQIDMKYLSDTEVEAVNKLLEQENAQLMAILDTYFENSYGTGDMSPMDITLIETELGEDEASLIGIWLLGEDGILTEVNFTTNEKEEIVLKNTVTGRYVFICYN